MGSTQISKPLRIPSPYTGLPTPRLALGGDGGFYHIVRALEVQDKPGLLKGLGAIQGSNFRADPNILE